MHGAALVDRKGREGTSVVRCLVVVFLSLLTSSVVEPKERNYVLFPRSPRCFVVSLRKRQVCHLFLLVLECFGYIILGFGWFLDDWRPFSASSGVLFLLRSVRSAVAPVGSLASPRPANAIALASARDRWNAIAETGWNQVSRPVYFKKPILFRLPGESKSYLCHVDGRCGCG